MEDLLHQAIRADPTDRTAWLALADWYEEAGQPDRAELLRLREVLRLAIDVPGRPDLEARMRQLLRDGVRPPAVTESLDLGRGVTLALALIPAGVFLMGAGGEPRFDNEAPCHEVTITRPFYLGIFPV